MGIDNWSETHRVVDQIERNLGRRFGRLEIDDDADFLGTRYRIG
jgi:hypothetical protein